MRTIKELLQLMLDNEQLFNDGLCFWANNIENQGYISFKEYEKLQYYIRSNRPSMFSSLDAFKNTGNHFYWKKGDIEPRIKWLHKHIAKN